MSQRTLIGVIVVLSAGAVVPIAAQNRAWSAPTTSWGEPDLQGTWTNETIAPFERPPSMADRAFLAEAEVKDIETRSAEQRDRADAVPARPGDVGSYNQAGFDSGTRGAEAR